MPETNWGRKETIIWPPHKPIYTFGAVFFAVVLTGLFVYLHLAFVLTPLQQFDLPIYIKTTIVASIRQSSKYQLLLMADKKGRALYARDVEMLRRDRRCKRMPSPSRWFCPIPPASAAWLISTAAHRRSIKTARL